MDAFLIHGGHRLRGRIRINGSKNATLPQTAAALLTDEPVVLRDVADLADTGNMIRLLGELGCEGGFEAMPDGRRALRLHTTSESNSWARYKLVSAMRASICVLGPLLARRGEARVSMPGGCAIGVRPVDLHLRGMRALGADIHLEGGDIVARAAASNGRLRGARVFLGGEFGPTVLGTANVMSAAALAEGRTIIESAACEPEVEDLANLLIKMGAKISGAGSPRIVVEGVEALHGAEHTVMADRIEAGTYVIAAAITNGDVTIENCPVEALTAVFDRLDHVGVEICIEDEHGEQRRPLSVNGNGNGLGQTESCTIRVGSARRLEPTQIVTQPHPGFPTDLQAQMMALLCMADGNSIITEKIFPDRFLHTAELMRMGANLMRTGPTVLVTGIRQLEGAEVMASDLRASASLVLAGLAARGKTTISRVYHLDRGYERMELSLQKLGLVIERVKMAD